MAWAAEFDASLDMDDPHESGFNSQQDADKFVATGYALAQRLRNELGPEYTVLTNIFANPKPAFRAGRRE